jgi:glycosyltransferase involved in cell wall biosynthesis
LTNSGEPAQAGAISIGARPIHATASGLTLFLFIKVQLMKKIAVVIPSYNNSRWYKCNLSSLYAQDYHRFRAIYVDDCSSDGTGELVEKFIARNNLAERIHLICNPLRVGAMQNLYNVIYSCDDDEVIVILDGDDWFAHNGVLNRLNTAYSDPSCWMTYGQYISWPDGMSGYSKEIPSHITKTNDFRGYEWCASHLRSFYAWLFKRIKKEDLISPYGTFYPMAWDQAIMFPMLEMAGHRAKFISDILYIYNAANPISDANLNRQLQRHLETIIRLQKRYDRL